MFATIERGGEIRRPDVRTPSKLTLYKPPLSRRLRVRYVWTTLPPTRLRLRLQCVSRKANGEQAAGTWQIRHA
jgi:hypothetical protein